ncbi:hypothetical protein [Acidithiobacillus sp. AMEEHan]|uniref:hypothetical protein n=1 Tax=Acidithiobacillus sp. AMEEHan TaxID=2994951 RepID=UPI0027E580FF|nr:hypothetical protein [Acidithiobacillus sp. AMEEHan]
MRARIIPLLPFVIPSLLLPLLAVDLWMHADPAFFAEYREDVLFALLIFVVAVRFFLLDLMLFYVSRSRRSLHMDLLQIVFLYLEVTAVTLFYFALLYEFFGVYRLFTYTGPDLAQHLLRLQGHDFGLALYVSMEFFTTLGIGDWIPRTPNAMLAVGIEALLGFVQSGVFFAVLIYAHQDRRGHPEEKGEHSS